MKNKKGFSLIEMLVVMAIIGILAGAITVGLNGQRKKAQQSKAFAEMSSVIQPMMMCWSDGGIVNTVSEGSNICSISSSYGKWPNLPTSPIDYSYSSSVASSGSWYLYAHSDTDDITICCNGTYSKCGILYEANNSCDEDKQLD